MEVESELAETIEMVGLPEIEPAAAPGLKLVEDLHGARCRPGVRACGNARDAAAARRACARGARCHARARARARARASARAGRGGVGRRDDRRRDAVAIAVDHPVRRSRPACRHARARAVHSAIRFARGAAADMVRASHTLCGIHRTGGFPLVADDRQGSRADADRARAAWRAAAGHRAAGARARDRGSRAVRVAHQGGKRLSRVATSRRQAPSSASWTNCARTPRPRQATPRPPAQVARLEEEASARRRRPAPAVDAVRRRAVNAAAPDALRHRPTPACAGTDAGGRDDDAALPAATADPLADIRDDVDAQVLPIFLDEAAELFPQAGEEVRAWRRSPADDRRARSCGARCTRSRAARGWPARCAWASSRI